MRFNKGQWVVKLYSILGKELASSPTCIAEEGRNWVRLDTDETLHYHRETGHEIAPIIPGCSSRIVLLEGQQ